VPVPVPTVPTSLSTSRFEDKLHLLRSRQLNTTQTLIYGGGGWRRVESKRGLDLKNPNSQNQDPIFTNYKLPDHEPGYPGGIFDPFNFSKVRLMKAPHHARTCAGSCWPCLAIHLRSSLS
jgi:hypothetical protein